MKLHILIFFILVSLHAQLKDPTMPGEKLKQVLDKTKTEQKINKSKDNKQVSDGEKATKPPTIKVEESHKEIERFFAETKFGGCIMIKEKSQITIMHDKKYYFCKVGDFLIIDNVKLKLISLHPDKAIFSHLSTGKNYQYYYRSPDEN